MATEYLFSNNATTTLAQSVSATATVLNVAEGTGALFPSPSSGQAFAVTLVDAATGLTNEICYCTSRSGDQLTVVRGREGTNAIAWSAGDTCANYITADVMESWLQESDLNGYLTQSDAAPTYVKKSGDTSTGTQYSSGWFWGGYNAGFGGGTETGALRWTNFGVSFGNPLASNNAAFSGNLCVSDIIGNVNDNSSGINMRGYDYQGKLYNWFFAWNGKVTTPGGVLAFESDLSGYVANTNPGISGALAGTSLCVNPSDGRAIFAYSGNTKIASLAWYSDVVGEATARTNADNTLQANITTVESKLPLPDGMHCQIFNVAIPNPCPEEGWLVDIPTGWKTHSNVTACDTGANVYSMSAKVENATQARLWAKYPTNGAWAGGGVATVTSYGYYS